MRSPADLSASDKQAWVQLEGRAIEPNAFLSPHFVLPALKHLDPGLKAVITWVERISAGMTTLVGVGVFRHRFGTRAFPWPHLEAYQSRHTYLGGMLVDRDGASGVIEALHEHISRAGSLWQGMELPRTDRAGALVEGLDQVTRRQGWEMPMLGLQDRAMLTLNECGEGLLRETLGKKLNEINRCQRRLAEMGLLTWHCHRAEIPARAVEDFLQLEHQGWKGESGTSMRSSPADEAFFREMTASFAGEQRALFTELQLDGRAVASTCNFVSGRMGFAFKVGWESELRKFGPGMLNEVEFIRHAATHCPDLESFDSGAAADSFINRLWLDRRQLGLVLMPSSRLAAGALRAVQRLRASRPVAQDATGMDADADITAIKV